ncbi:MAG TPA: methionyl-tRNA formyltransferase [Acidobacteria bacterium]|nr:methionyl-tRNA formyltransferase [Acidobacteriota bacterium]
MRLAWCMIRAMKLVFFGTPEFSLPTLTRLVAGGHEVAQVVPRPDKPVGRKQEVMPPPVAVTARKLGLPVLQPKSLRGDEVVAKLAATGAEAGVVVAYGKLIPPRVLELFPRGCLNVHPSLLPRHRGPSPIQWAIACGDRVTGVTTMLLDEGMDTGPILLQRRVEIGPRETAEELSARLAELGAQLMLETLEGLENGTVTPRPQPSKGVSVTPMIRRQFGKVDWSHPAQKIFDRLRAFTPWPGLYTGFRGGRLKIHGLEVVTPPPPGEERPGTVLSADPDGIVVRCGRGTAARITELQREGRRRMPADAFLIGERVSAGEHFG